MIKETQIDKMQIRPNIQNKQKKKNKRLIIKS